MHHITLHANSSSPPAAPRARPYPAVVGAPNQKPIGLFTVYKVPHGHMWFRPPSTTCGVADAATGQRERTAGWQLLPHDQE